MDQALSILTSMGVNQSFFLMFAVVVVFYFVMNFVALGPLTKILVERDERIDGRQAQSLAYAEEASNLEKTFSENMKGTHREAASSFAKLKASALQKQNAMLSKAREEAQTKVSGVRQEVATNVAAEFSKVASEIPTLAALVLDRILIERGSAKPKKPAMNPEV